MQKGDFAKRKREETIMQHESAIDSMFLSYMEKEYGDNSEQFEGWNRNDMYYAFFKGWEMHNEQG